MVKNTKIANITEYTILENIGKYRLVSVYSLTQINVPVYNYAKVK